jgi:hypothetical protein
MELKTLELISRPIQAVQFTGHNREDLRQWVQDKLAFQSVTATEDRFYLPSVGGMEVLEVGDWIFYDREDNAFKGATDEAVKAHYKEVKR